MNFLWLQNLSQSCSFDKEVRLVHVSYERIPSDLKNGTAGTELLITEWGGRRGDVMGGGGGGGVMFLVAIATFVSLDFLSCHA